jgi:ferrochelatase
VRRYLKEFLLDPRVIDAPWPIRQFVVRCCILPFRPKASAEAYRTVWTEQGSPLVATSRAVAKQLAQRLSVPVFLAMRYGQPDIPSVLAQMQKAGVREALLIPQYPHYAMSSYETVVARVAECARVHAPEIRWDVQPPFPDRPDYIAALAQVAGTYLAKEEWDHLLFSFHGLPERHIRQGDVTGQHCLVREDCCEVRHPSQGVCYRHQTRQTARAVAAALGLPPERWSIAYQSRLGREPWLAPYTDFELERLARAGVRRLRVICPAFVADCLETLEEIAVRGRETFLHAGGISFEMIPCLNEHPAWIQVLEGMISEWVAARLRLSKARPSH